MFCLSHKLHDNNHDPNSLDAWCLVVCLLVCITAAVQHAGPLLSCTARHLKRTMYCDMFCYIVSDWVDAGLGLGRQCMSQRWSVLWGSREL